MTDPRTVQAVERVRLELVTRKFMVMVLASIGVWVGIAIMLMGAPNFIEEWFSPWSRYSIGAVAFLAGLSTVIAGVFNDHHRKVWWSEVIGLAVLTLWYAGMGVSYSWLLWQQGSQFAYPGEPLPPASTGRGYVPMVYLGLMLLTATPLLTMVRLGRCEKPPSED